MGRQEENQASSVWGPKEYVVKIYIVIERDIGLAALIIMYLSLRGGRALYIACLTHYIMSYW